MNSTQPQGASETTAVERIKAAQILAVVVVDDPGYAPALVDALQAGGISGIELTLRTAGAFEALRLVCSAYPDFLVGMGTLIEEAQIRPAIEAGADFAVAPGCNPAILRAAAAAGLPFFPGVATPSDIEMALAEGRTLMKFFPAEPSGGLPYLRSMAAPYFHRGVSFIPLGGLDETNFTTYLDDPLISAVGGSWIAPRGLIQKRDWSSITRNARQAMAKLAE
jgi:2-dehydro-3-deoxyphosphogluconate aldolase / (4S)-4-hydroxy-2-oxoglutarate aldolase